MNFLLYLFIGAGLLQAILAIPMILGKIPPNPIYGMRTAATMSEPKLWYLANRYTGKWLFATGILIAAAAIGLYLIPGLSVDTYAYAVLAVVVVGLGLMLQRSFRYLKSLQE